MVRPAPSGDRPIRRILIALSLAGSLAAAQPALLDQARSFLFSVWSETGCHIDPSGKCAPSTDEGCHIDPSGGCLTERADTGTIIDPDGRS